MRRAMRSAGELSELGAGPKSVLLQECGRTIANAGPHSSPGGLRIAVDDLGTRLFIAQLPLKDFPIDTLKIDRSYLGYAAGNQRLASGQSHCGVGRRPSSYG